MKNAKISKKFKKLLSAGLVLATLGTSPVLASAEELEYYGDPIPGDLIDIDYVDSYNVIKRVNGQRVDDYTAETYDEAVNSLLKRDETVSASYEDDYIVDYFAGDEHFGMDEQAARDYCTAYGYTSITGIITHTYVIDVVKKTSSDTDEIEETYDKSLDGIIAYVTIENLNLRKGNNTSTAVLGVYPQGTKVTLTGKEADRMLEVITPDGKKGWMGSKYLEITNERASKKQTETPKKETKVETSLSIDDPFFEQEIPGTGVSILEMAQMICEQNEITVAAEEHLNIIDEYDNTILYSGDMIDINEFLISNNYDTGNWSSGEYASVVLRTNKKYGDFTLFSLRDDTDIETQINNAMIQMESEIGDAMSSLDVEDMQGIVLVKNTDFYAIPLVNVVEETSTDRYTQFEDFKGILDTYTQTGNGEYVLDSNSYFENDADRIFVKHFMGRANELFNVYANFKLNDVPSVCNSIIEDYTYTVMEGYPIGIKINGEEITVSYQDLSDEAKAYIDAIVVKAINIKGGIGPFDLFGNFTGDKIIDYINNTYYDNINNFYAGKGNQLIK